MFNKANPNLARTVDPNAAQVLYKELVFKDQSPPALPRAFAVMPFGKKKGFDGNIIDFNAIYQDLIKPAMKDAGFEPFRADEETVSGDILTDMFQELLLADLVIVDMSIDNANVFYELGVRHAFRKRGIVHIQAGRSYMPFDVFHVRTIPYHLNEDGVPDPDFLDKDRQAIARTTRDTWASESESVHSPIFNLLSGLQEPERKALRTPLALGFWRELNDWKELVEIAKSKKHLGDILLLTEEITNPMIKEEAIEEAGKALRSMGRNELALQQYRAGLRLNSRNILFRREEAFHLNRLGRMDEAVVKLEGILAEYPDDVDAAGYLGRIYKDMWVESWKRIEDPKKRLEEAFASYHWLLKAALTYLEGYKHNLSYIYPGVNALTLALILVNLADQFDDKSEPDPDIEAVRQMLPELRGTLTFALQNMAEDPKADYWTLVSLAELRLMTEERVRNVTRAYRKALIVARKNVFSLQSSLDQLQMIDSLNMRTEYVRAAVRILEDELSRVQKRELGEDEHARKTITEVNVLLFSGYMIDQPDQIEKRFPQDPKMEAEIRSRLEDLFKRIHLDNNDIAFTAGCSAGGEMIFIELCTDLGVNVEVLLPMSEAAYIRQFITPAGEEWVDRYFAIRNCENVRIRYQTDHIGQPPENANLFERNNRWALYSSLLHGLDKVRLVAVWDGKTTGEDFDHRLVSNMVAQMRQLGGRVEHLNTTKFDFWRQRAVEKRVEDALDSLSQDEEKKERRPRRLPTPILTKVAEESAEPQ